MSPTQVSRRDLKAGLYHILKNMDVVSVTSATGLLLSVKGADIEWELNGRLAINCVKSSLIVNPS